MARSDITISRLRSRLVLSLASATIVGFALVAFIGTTSSLTMQLAAMGGMIALAIGLLIHLSAGSRQRDQKHTRLLRSLQAPVTLARSPGLLDLHGDWSRSLVALAEHADDRLREVALLKLFSVSEELRTLARGQVVYRATESWRKVYEEILRTAGLKRYQSVAYIRTEDYWRDIPGERSMQLNFDLATQGLKIERLLILCDFLWPPAAALPEGDIRKWMERQRSGGVQLWLVRESELLHEPDLLVDFGIYGRKATGIQEVDLQGRTQRFILDFDGQSIELAQDRWRRLLIYAVCYEELLEPSSPLNDL